MEVNSASGRVHGIYNGRLAEAEIRKHPRERAPRLLIEGGEPLDLRVYDRSCDCYIERNGDGRIVNAFHVLGMGPMPAVPPRIAAAEDLRHTLAEALAPFREVAEDQGLDPEDVRDLARILLRPETVHRDFAATGSARQAQDLIVVRRIEYLETALGALHREVAQRLGADVVFAVDDLEP